MNIDYIIVQAGGKGTRLGHITKNKPKALTPIDNLPMIFHLFRKYPDKRFIVIADYHREVLRKYLAAFADIKYMVVDAEGTGTCAGLGQALELIPDDRELLYIWSDLVLPESFEFPEESGDYLGLSQTFLCRWSYKNSEFCEERSEEYGVAGFFLFKNKAALDGVPQSGEFVRWLKDKEKNFKTVGLAGTREFGLLEEYEKLAQIKTRPFNRIRSDGDMLVKEPVDEQGRKLAVRECAWYEKVREFDIKGIPKIYDCELPR